MAEIHDIHQAREPQRREAGDSGDNPHSRQAALIVSSLPDSKVAALAVLELATQWIMLFG